MRAAGIEGPQACAKGLRHAFGLGRNVDTFDWLRHYVYREVRLWWVPGGGQAVFIAWREHLFTRGQDFTANEHPTPLHSSETWHIAKSGAYEHGLVLRAIQNICRGDPVFAWSSPGVTYEPALSDNSRGPGQASPGGGAGAGLPHARALRACASAAASPGSDLSFIPSPRVQRRAPHYLTGRRPLAPGSGS